MRFLKVLLSLVVVCTAYVGDHIVFKSEYSTSFQFRAIADSIVHGTLGLLSSILFFSHENNINLQIVVFNAIFCTFMSSFIDVDHFIIAKSIYMKDLTNLKSRGIFHNTTFWVLLTSLLLLYSYLQKSLTTYLLSFMLILAFSSHHIRDANRRGLWLYPFGSTPAIDKHLYVILIAVLPHIFAYFYSMFKGGFSKNFVVDYAMVV